MSNNSKENAKNRNHMLEITFSTLGNKWIILTLILLIRPIYHGILTCLLCCVYDTKIRIKFSI